MYALALVLILGSALAVEAAVDPVCGACPSKNCTYSKRLNCSCTGGTRTIEIVSPGDIEYFNVSLGFAVDDTGSMGGEIASVKASISDVVTATSGLFGSYIIDSFNDPYVFKLIESTDVAAITAFVNTINAYGGGDCPEFALTGIRDVATRASPGSVIFMFTDASAKDLTLEPTLQALLVSKNIRLNVMVTGNLCGSGLGGEYARLTSATNGTIYTTLEKSDVDYVMNYIKNFAKYGIRFIRGMPKTLDDLKALAGGSCSCTTTVTDLVCVPLPEPVSECLMKCPAGSERLEVRKKFCRPAPCVPKFRSLGFAIDNTGSMGEEILAVKNAVSGIVSNSVIFNDFVVGEFGDPYVKHVVKSTNVGVIQAFVNAIVASGGGDCPEFAMSGIKDVAYKVGTNSVIILITDASAKDARKTKAVKKLLLAKKITLLVIATGPLCEAGSYKNEYHELAKATGGAVMTLTAKTSMAEVMNYIMMAAAGKYALLPFPTSLDEMTKLPTVDCCKWIVKCRCVKPKDQCPYGRRRVTTRTKVCAPLTECISKQVGSLAFVIDDTGSMGSAIAAIKTEISTIIASNVVFTDFVVGTFGDPYVQHVIKSSSVSVIQPFVNAITAGGGGDCPEFAMSGIFDAATLALPDSVLVLFTDASAKDVIQTAAVSNLLQIKRIQLYAIITGGLCGPGAYTGEFHSLATATGGSVLTVTATTTVKDVLHFIELAAAGQVPLSLLPSVISLGTLPSISNCWTQEFSTCVCDCSNRVSPLVLTSEPAAPTGPKLV